MELPPRLGLGIIYFPFAEGLIYLESVSGVKVQRWDGVRHSTLLDLWVNLYSLCSIS